MNDTNRVVNRLLLALVGVGCLLASGLAVLLLVSPAAREQWTSVSRSVVPALDAAFGRPLWPSTSLSLAAVGALAAAVVFVVLLAVLVLRAGRGSTSTVVTAAGDDGSTEVAADVASALLRDWLQSVPGVAGVDVSAYRVRREPALRLTVRCRRGASPRIVADAVEEAVGLLDTALGVRLPVFAQLVGGFRARLRPAVRIETSTGAARPS
ncbi:MAG: hypothetical protein AAGC66_01510 [Leifsonia sp.]